MSPLKISADVDHKQHRKLPANSPGVQAAILRTLEGNNMVLISGNTGSGKSSQVPQLLLDRLPGCRSVLVTQPRRVAAVSLARRVAAERGCEVGGEVGYHIGQERRSSSSVTRLLFCTCGLLLEELRSNGLAVFEGHGAVVIDEVHERSVESDLCLAYIKTLLTSKSTHGCSTKFVLMSATFDSRRYKDFFSPVLERHLNVVAVADSVSDGLLQTSTLSIETRYLSDAVALVNDRLVPPACPAAFSAEVSEALKQAKPNLRVALQLIARLVSVLHEREERTDRHIMVFLPTYRSLEDCYTAVKGMHLPLDVHALHSSTDTEACIRAIECTQPGKRKLVLATNVAESSLTICDVAYIIDLCRNVEISWNVEEQSSRAVVRFASKSQARQRAGRTGRTCSGIVFRLVERRQWEGLPEFETPGIQLASLREECLRLCCASGLRSGAAGMLAMCLDPPDPSRVEAALEALVTLRAVTVKQKDARGRPSRLTHVPSPYGRILACMPLALPASRLVVAAASSGLLREGALLAGILELMPQPIVRPFAAAAHYARNLSHFGAPPSAATPFDIAIANFSAVLAFQLECHFRPLAHALAIDAMVDESARAVSVGGLRPWLGEGGEGEWGAASALDAVEWCAHWKLLRSAVAGALEMATQLEGVVHKHSAHLQAANFGRGDGWLGISLRHVCPIGDTSPRTAEALCGEEVLGVLSRLLAASSAPLPPSLLLAEARRSRAAASNAPACVYFQRGGCANGEACRFSHDPSTELPLCRAIAKGDTCPYGASCHYRHYTNQTRPAGGDGGSILTDFLTDGGEFAGDEGEESESNLVGSAWGALWNRLGAVLLLGEGDFGFAQAVHSFGCRTVIATTDATRAATIAVYGPAAEKRVSGMEGAQHSVLFGVDATQLQAHEEVVKACCLDECGLVVWNFPFTGVDEDLYAHQLLMRRLFCSLARLRASSGARFRFATALQADQFSRWKVHSASHAYGWELVTVERFHMSSFPGYEPKRNSLNESFPATAPKVYLFRFSALEESVDEQIRLLQVGLRAMNSAASGGG